MAKTKNQQLKRNKQEIQRLKHALKGRSLLVISSGFCASLHSRNLFKVTRHNNGIYRKMVDEFKAKNSTQIDLFGEVFKTIICLK